MTVTYIQDVHTAGRVGTFMRLLTRWKGGVAKGIWRALLIYLASYATISLVYRFLFSLDEDIKAGFEKFCVFTGKYTDYIPLGFILGFYVTQVVNRWWTQVMTIPWLDSLCMNLATYMPGNKMKKTRRLVTRWAMLANILTLRKISCSVFKRFPTYEYLVETGLMTERELKKLEKLDKLTEGLHATSWYPIQWAQAAIRKAREEGSISSDLLFQELQENLKAISSGNGTLLMYAWVNIPLVYTQLVTIVVHVYILVTLLSRQYLTPTRYLPDGPMGGFVLDPDGTTKSINLVGYDDSNVDYFVPYFTIIQFVFYFGWLNVAETLLNPFGEDDDDIDANYIIDRNFQIGYFMVSTEDSDEDPEEDTYGDSIPPPTLPHTVSSYKHKEPAPVFLTDNVHLSEESMMLNNPDHPAFSKLRVSLSPNLNRNHTSIDLLRSRLDSSANKNEEPGSSPTIFNKSDDSEASKDD